MKRVKLLIVDDDANFTELVSRAFGREIDVLQAPDGRQGLAMAKAARPDIILLDVMLPHVSGVEMLRRLQGEEETRAIPVLLITGSRFDPGTWEILRLEPNLRACLRKPCMLGALWTEISNAVAGNRHERL